jgi:hypothetical protein
MQELFSQINLMKKMLSTRKSPYIQFIENLPKFRINNYTIYS